MDEEIAADVREFGWSAANVFDAQPPFMYTIGFKHSCQHPEVIVFGLEPDNAHVLLSQLCRDITGGKSYAGPGIYTVTIGDDEHRVGFRRVHPTQHQLYLGFAMGFLTNIGRMGELEAVQAFWPDRTGKFPFEPGCNQSVHQLQPRLDIGLSPREVRQWERRWE